MPNGAQTPTEEGEASGGESQDEEEWDSDVAGDDDDDDDDDGDDDDAEPYAVFLQIFLQSSFTPTSASILPSLHKGRPMTLKKSPVMPSTKSEA